MKYELAKQLKDSKFPQIHSGDSRWITKIGDFVAFYRIDDNGNYRGINTSKDAVENDLCYYPTLSELIEACGYKFYNLTRLQPKEIKDKWGAEGTEDEDLYLGNSPEEAVANLWLALQDNKEKV